MNRHQREGLLRHLDLEGAPLNYETLDRIATLHQYYQAEHLRPAPPAAVAVSRDVYERLWHVCHAYSRPSGRTIETPQRYDPADADLATGTRIHGLLWVALDVPRPNSLYVLSRTPRARDRWRDVANEVLWAWRNLGPETDERSYEDIHGYAARGEPTEEQRANAEKIKASMLAALEGMATSRGSDGEG